MKKAPGLQVTIDQNLALALFDRIGFSALVIIAIATFWFAKK